MFQISDSGPRILITAFAIMIGFLLLIFLYYIFAEQLGADVIIDEPRPLTSTDMHNIANASRSSVNYSGLDGEDVHATPNVIQNQLPADPSDPDYVPPGFKKKVGGGKTKQVFNIGNNIYTYKDANAVCKAFGAELATYPQLVASYKKGANWCNYGWTKGQLALYPTQKDAWLKLQEEDPERRNDCGNVGINGGYFENPDMLFGVNCYGIKPAPRDHEKVKYNNKTAKEYELERQISKIKKNLDNLSVLPFNKKKWSNCN